MNDALTALKELIGFRIKIEELEKLYEDENNTYKQEVNEEAQRLKFSPGETRPLDKILEQCKKGMLAEILVREAVHALMPVSEETITKYATKYWLSKSKNLDAAVRYHDLIDELGNVYEVKNWNSAQRHNNTVLFLHNDALSYNHSKYLVIFCEEEDKLFLYDVIDIDAPASKYNTVKIYSDTISFTASDKMVEFFKKYTKIPVEFYRGKAPSSKEIPFETYKSETLIGKATGEWFLENMRNSKYANGGYFVFSSIIPLIK